MSVQTNGAATNIPSSSKLKEKSSKKRKHEDSEQTPSSPKKQKHREEEDADAVVTNDKKSKEKRADKLKRKNDAERPQEENVELKSGTTIDSPKKKRRKEKSKHAEEGTTEHVTPTDQDTFPDAPDEGAAQPDRSNGENLEKKPKKRKKQKPADTDVEIADATPVPEPSPQLQNPDLEPGPESTTIEEGDPLQLEEKSLGVNFLDSSDPTSFYSTRISLYLSIPAITLPQHAASAILSLHLAPLLLQYFPPAKGIVMGFERPVLSAKANSTINLPLRPPKGEDGDEEAEREEDRSKVKEILAQTSDQFGAAWVWLTVTFLVFRPQRGDELFGWNNVASEGFVGLVCYNYFQTAIGSNRIPKEWKWRGLRAEERRKKKKGRKEKMLEDGSRSYSTPPPSSGVADEQTREEIEGQTGFYLESGDKVPETMKFRVVDTEMVPSGEKGKWSLQIDATLLGEDEEEKVVEEDRLRWERMHNRQPGTLAPQMSGGLGVSREGSVVSANSSSVGAAAGASSRHRVAY